MLIFTLLAVPDASSSGSATETAAAAAAEEEEPTAEEEEPATDVVATDEEETSEEGEARVVLIVLAMGLEEPKCASCLGANCGCRHIHRVRGVNKPGVRGAVEKKIDAGCHIRLREHIALRGRQNGARRNRRCAPTSGDGEEGARA